MLNRWFTRKEILSIRKEINLAQIKEIQRKATLSYFPHLPERPRRKRKFGNVLCCQGHAETGPLILYWRLFQWNNT